VFNETFGVASLIFLVENVIESMSLSDDDAISEIPQTQYPEASCRYIWSPPNTRLLTRTQLKAEIMISCLSLS
jgi:hypothetical protein